MLTQTYKYYQRFKQDSPLIKLLVSSIQMIIFVPYLISVSRYLPYCKLVYSSREACNNVTFQLVEHGLDVLRWTRSLVLSCYHWLKDPFRLVRVPSVTISGRKFWPSSIGAWIQNLPYQFVFFMLKASLQVLMDFIDGRIWIVGIVRQLLLFK